MFGTFLKAQETSPTLVLNHAKMGDDGAREVAHFVAPNTHLVRLDLSGNEITSTGAKHLAGAVKQSVTLESLVLKHNRIGEAGEIGLAALCRAAVACSSLRHLDLRHNSLTGALAATCLGEMLSGNEHLTHLELSWNPLDPAGGQVLLEHLRRNTTLFDCQLSGCNIPQETLLHIAELLLRNRRANGADLAAGPFMATIDPGFGSTGVRSMARARGEALLAPEPLELISAERRSNQQRCTSSWTRRTRS